MTKEVKGNRVQAILEHTEYRGSGIPGVSRHIIMKNRKSTTQRLELMKYNLVLREMTLHKEVK